MVAAGAAAGVTRFDFTDVEPINYRTDDPCGMIQGEIIAETGRKKQIIVGIVRFKDYLFYFMTAADAVGCLRSTCH